MSGSVGQPGRHAIRPERRLVLSMHPYTAIEKNEDGSGGGITLRVRGERQEPYFVDVVWGKTTEIEVVL